MWLEIALFLPFEMDPTLSHKVMSTSVKGLIPIKEPCWIVDPIADFRHFSILIVFGTKTRNFTWDLADIRRRLA